MEIRYYSATNQMGGITEYAYFNGKTYYHFKNGYFKLTNRPYTLLHHDLWRAHGREVPYGYELHHKDRNKRNNTIDNLQLMTKREHTALHQREASPETVTCRECGIIFKRICRRTTLCNQCTAKHTAEYKAEWTKKNRKKLNESSLAYYSKHKEERRCPVCGKSFLTYKYGPQKTCGRSCAASYRMAVRPKSQNRCCIDGCMRKYYAKGFCELHYKRARRQKSHQTPP